MENVIIIGGGPAGLAASIYNARAGLNPLVIAGSPSGGQLTLTTEVENYPGFSSILGPELIQKMREHALKFGVRIVNENVVKVDFARSLDGSHETHRIYTTNKTYESKAVIIATGAKALWLGLESEQRLRGKGVSACATCDGFFFKDKTVAVIGGGDTAMEEALTLTKFASKVYIIHRRGEFRASKIMQDRVKKHQNIHVIYNAEVKEVLGKSHVEGVIVKIKPSDKELLKKNKEEIEKISPRLLQMKVLGIDNESITGQFPIDGFFLAIGHKPDTDIFKGQIELDQKGYIITTERAAVEFFKSEALSTKSETNSKGLENLNLINYDLFRNSKFEIRNFRSSTSVNGVFAAGDCVDHKYRQAATAVGMGVAAALEAEKYLEADI